MEKGSNMEKRLVKVSALEAESGERSEPDGAVRALGRPDPEVLENPTRRKFTAEYKLNILRLADACKTPGSLGALLRREGLYHSNLATWRRQRNAGILEALEPRKRGPKAKEPDPLVIEMGRLRQENERLQKRLKQAELIIDAQKKISQILGITLETQVQSGKD
jgi:transposase-like protein